MVKQLKIYQHIQHLRRGSERPDVVRGHGYATTAGLHLREGRHDQLHAVSGELFREARRASEEAEAAAVIGFIQGTHDEIVE